MRVQENCLRYAMRVEAAIDADGHPLTIIAGTGAMLLARSTYLRARNLPGQKTFRQEAHAILAEILDETELLMNQCEGRA